MLNKKYDYNATYTNNTSGIRGVSYDAGKRKWEVKFQYKGHRTRLGFFDTIKEAAAARQEFLSQSAKQRQEMDVAKRASKAGLELLAALESMINLFEDEGVPPKWADTVQDAIGVVHRIKGE